MSSFALPLLRHGKFAFGVGALAVVCMTTPVSAQDAEERAAADALFDAARSLMEQGKYEEACPKFRDSYDLDPGVGTLLNLALCYKQGSRTASAWSVYREAAAAARTAGQTDREGLARTEAEKLEGSLVKLLIDVAAEAEVDGLQIKRDEQTLKPSLYGVGIPVDPGEITIVATAPGYATRSATVKVVGEGKTITFRLETMTPEGQPKGATAPPPSQEPESTPPPEGEESTATGGPKPEEPLDSPGAGRSPWPWVLGGFGVAAAGTGTVFAFLSKSDYDKSVEICADPQAGCSRTDVQTHEDLKTSTRTKAIVAYAGWGVGGAALIGAGVWLLLGQSNSESGLTLQPLVGQESWGLSASGSF